MKKNDNKRFQKDVQTVESKADKAWQIPEAQRTKRQKQRNSKEKMQTLWKNKSEHWKIRAKAIQEVFTDWLKTDEKRVLESMQQLRKTAEKRLRVVENAAKIARKMLEKALRPLTSVFEKELKRLRSFVKSAGTRIRNDFRKFLIVYFIIAKEINSRGEVRERGDIYEKARDEQLLRNSVFAESVKNNLLNDPVRSTNDIKDLTYGMLRANHCDDILQFAFDYITDYRGGEKAVDIAIKSYEKVRSRCGRFIKALEKRIIIDWEKVKIPELKEKREEVAEPKKAA